MDLRLNVSTWIFLLATLLTAHDLFLHSVNAQESDDDHPQKHQHAEDADADFDELIGERDEADEPLEVRPASDFGDLANHPGSLNSGKLQIAFCVSCGYRQAFDEFSRILTEKYPNILIEGSNYPPAPLKSFAAQAFGILKIGLIIAIISGRDIFSMLGFPTPGVFTWATQNKLSACMMLFLLGNTVETSLISTGAFEIFFNGQNVWSKLESGRIPSPGELMQIIDSQLEMTGAKTADTFSFES